MRKAFIQAIRAELTANPSMAVFLGDISVAGFLNPQDQLVERVYNCGILEQAMVSFAAGCSVAGIYPVVQTIVPFLVERAFEQIKLDFCAHELPGLLVGVGGGLEYSKLGYTHQTLWDTALLANLDGLTLFTPTTGAAEVRFVLPQLIRHGRLAYARLTECYLSGSDPTPDGIEVASPIGTVKGSRDALVVCGAFPGIQGLVETARSDVYAYSFPNRVPRNLGDLSRYSRLDVWEFGTSPILSTRLKSALPHVAITSHHQHATFFRSYGTRAASEFIAGNWTTHA